MTEKTIKEIQNHVQKEAIKNLAYFNMTGTPIFGLKFLGLKDIAKVLADRSK